MNRRLALLAFLTASTLAPFAAAQEVVIGYGGLPYKASGESPTGIQVSESALLHVGLGTEAGYDTNVFYQDTNRHGSTIIRVLPYLHLTNAPRGGNAQARTLSFDARVGMLYRRYQSDDPALDPYRNAWMPNAGVALSLGSGQFSWGVADVFVRTEDAPYSPAALVLTRYNNQFSTEGRWSPGGGRITGLLRYTNMFDYLENTYSYATSLTQTLMADGSWRWLPKTAIFLNVSQGYVMYLDDNAAANGKVSSYPLRITTGLRGLLTDRITAVLAVGYNNAFYSSGVSTSGFAGSFYGDLALTFRATALARITAGARHSFENAVISPFTYSDSVYASYVQQIAGRFALDLSARLSRIAYQGFQPAPGMFFERIDYLAQVGAQMDYFLRNWAYVGVGYSLLANDSNYSLNGNSASYVKQLILARLGITY